MNFAAVGCSHHSASIALRERVACSADQVAAALDGLRGEFPRAELVLLSTCNRMEIYTAAENGSLPSREQLAGFLGRFHHIDAEEIRAQLYQHSGEQAVRHLFLVASSLDSMVLGEAQILSQVKQAYQQASARGTAGPLCHAAFQAAIRTAKRVAGETAIHQRRVSIPSLAVADFAQRIFERFDDKRILVIGAGEMAEETLRYLRDQGARDLTVVNRREDRAVDLARRWQGRVIAWERLLEGLADADLVISTTGSAEPIVSLDKFRRIEAPRYERPLFILDLAVPRDFEPAIGDLPGVYLYSIDDLREACQRNRRQRDKELPAAMRIIDEEAGRFMADLHHRVTGPVIQQLREGWQKPKEEELRRLLNKLPGLDAQARDEIRQSFDRLINKLLHPPLESLRQESRHGIPHALIDALSKLFQLKD